MSNFCKLHGNTDAPCPECRLLDNELLSELRRERDEARMDLTNFQLIARQAQKTADKLAEENYRLRALLREVEWAECSDCSRCKTCRGWNAKCPVCLGCKVCGHMSDCQLASALEER